MKNIQKDKLQHQNQEVSKSNLEVNSISNLSHFNTDEEFEKVKAYPVNRTFNSLMAFMVVVICIGLGVIIGCLILLFA